MTSAVCQPRTSRSTSVVRRAALAASVSAWLLCCGCGPSPDGADTQKPPIDLRAAKRVAVEFRRRAEAANDLLQAVRREAAIVRQSDQRIDALLDKIEQEKVGFAAGRSRRPQPVAVNSAELTVRLQPDWETLDAEQRKLEAAMLRCRLLRDRAAVYRSEASRAIERFGPSIAAEARILNRVLDDFDAEVLAAVDAEGLTDERRQAATDIAAVLAQLPLPPDPTEATAPLIDTSPVATTPRHTQNSPAPRTEAPSVVIEGPPDNAVEIDPGTKRQATVCTIKPPEAGVDLALLAALNLPDVSISLGPAQEQGDATEWELKYEKRRINVVVGRFTYTVNSGEVRFRRSPGSPPPSAIAEAVRNCVLVVRSGGVRRQFQLRQPLEIQSWTDASRFQHGASSLSYTASVPTEIQLTANPELELEIAPQFGAFDGEAGAQTKTVRLRDAAPLAIVATNELSMQISAAQAPGSDLMINVLLLGIAGPRANDPKSSGAFCTQALLTDLIAAMESERIQAATNIENIRLQARARAAEPSPVAIQQELARAQTNIANLTSEYWRQAAQQQVAYNLVNGFITQRDAIKIKVSFRYPTHTVHYASIGGPLRPAPYVERRR